MFTTGQAYLEGSVVLLLASLIHSSHKYNEFSRSPGTQGHAAHTDPSHGHGSTSPSVWSRHHCNTFTAVQGAMRGAAENHNADIAEIE